MNDEQQKPLTIGEIEERRQNLAFIRDNAPTSPPHQHLFMTTLGMQEGWLATVDGLVAKLEAVEKEAGKYADPVLPSTVQALRKRILAIVRKP